MPPKIYGAHFHHSIKMSDLSRNPGLFVINFYINALLTDNGAGVTEWLVKYKDHRYEVDQCNLHALYIIDYMRRRTHTEFMGFELQRFGDVLRLSKLSEDKIVISRAVLEVAYDKEVKAHRQTRLLLQMALEEVGEEKAKAIRQRLAEI